MLAVFYLIIHAKYESLVILIDRSENILWEIVFLSGKVYIM